MMTEERMEQLTKEKIRKLPINNLDSNWLTADPDYTELQNKFNREKLNEIFDFFNSSMRLANISKNKVTRIEYDLVTAEYEFSLGYITCALSTLFLLLLL